MVMTNPWFVGGVVIVVLVILAGLFWWLHKEGKLPF